jgi:hypothetical protein
LPAPAMRNASLDERAIIRSSLDPNVAGGPDVVVKGPV